VDQNENRDLISAANFAQNPNPSSVSRRAEREIIVFSLRVGAVGGHFATVSFPRRELGLEDGWGSDRAVPKVAVLASSRARGGDEAAAGAV
jgi:hypothetical protein